MFRVVEVFLKDYQSMEDESRVLVGRVSELWRYPIKTMQGEMLKMATIGKKGLIGDRAFALMDKQTGRIISAKNPIKWEGVFRFSAKTLSIMKDGRSIQKPSITFPDGESVFVDDKNINEILSEKIGRPVTLLSHVPEDATVEKLSLEEEELGMVGTPSCLEKLSPFDFFDGGKLHILTTTALNNLKEKYKEGTFDARRFRPNIVIDSDDSEYSANMSLGMENEWKYLMIEVGDKVKLKVTKPTIRCIMTTLAQANLPKDNKILKTINYSNNGYLGAYTQTLEPGTIEVDDAVWLVGSRLNEESRSRPESQNAPSLP